MKRKIIVIGLAIMMITMVFLAITPTISATVTYPVDPDSPMVPPPDAPPGVAYEDFETGVDGMYGGGGPITTTIPGLEFVTTAGQDWWWGDWRLGVYNGKYPSGSYTSQGNLWAWLGVSQGSGIIDFTEGCASYFSVCTSTYSGLTIDAYADDGTLLANSGWATSNTNTGKMTRLSISRPTRDIGYVIVHDTGNYWLIDRLWTDAPGVGLEISVDIKPGSCPNPINLKGKGVLPVAICGTEDFDVTTIDPGSILLICEGYEEGVSPLCWSYEDVATPYTGEEECGCHDLDGDGILDLALKFDKQEVVATLELEDFEGETIPLIITGNLIEDEDGTPFDGQDCVWIIEHKEETKDKSFVNTRSIYYQLLDKFLQRFPMLRLILSYLIL